MLEGWTTVHVTQLGNLGGVVKSPLAQFADELLSPHWGISAENESCKANLLSFPNQVAAAIEQVAVVLSPGPARQSKRLGSSWK